MRRWIACVAAGLLAAAATARAVEVSGNVPKPNQQFGAGADYKLVGDTTFGWETRLLAGNIDINGHKLVMETGGGNQTTFSGVLSGTGRFDWIGGGSVACQTLPSFLKGDKPNTFSGPLTVVRGMLALAKPAGVDAVAGDLVLGGGANQAIVRLDAPNQIKDTANLLLTGKHEGRLWTQGHSETLGTLDLQTHGYLDLGDGASTLTFADSSGKSWDLSKTLTIQHWTEGKDKVAFGQGPSGLTKEQLARVGFADPSGREPGLTTAKMLPDGQVVPDVRVQAVKPPFDVTTEAIAARKKVYDVPGRAALSGEGTPLKDGMRIAFFGDSITWLNGYIEAIQKALKAGAGTKSLDVKLLNHGINGGGVLSVRDGTDKAAYVSPSQKDGKQAPFAEVIAADKADVAVVFIGINDVWWRNTKPEEFEKALRDIAAAAQARKCRLVLATLALHQEMPDGTNPKDPGCEQFAAITRQVAAATGATLVDLRKACLAYLQNHNAELRVDGTLHMVSTGILTGDGVHPNSTGTELLADHIAQGIYEALKR
jgi:lysophospholipase L1-like esterase